MLHFYEFEVIDELTGVKLKKDILLTMICDISEEVMTDDEEITEDSKFYLSKNHARITLANGSFYTVCKSRDSVRAIVQKILEKYNNIPVNFYQESNEPLNKSDSTNDNNDRF